MQSITIPLLKASSSPPAPKVRILDGSENTRAWGLQELYEQHNDYVKEILYKTPAYNKDYYNSLMDSFQWIWKTQ